MSGYDKIMGRQVIPIENKSEYDFSPLPKPFDWQLNALKAWEQYSCLGTFDCSVGSGKSNLGYMAIKKYNPLKTLIVVPTIELQNQHKKNLIKDLLIKEEDIGLVGNGQEDFTKLITIAIVNSVRFDKLIGMHFNLLILDEIHNYFSLCNSTFLKAGKYDMVMGLSATPKRIDGLHIPWFEKYPIVYWYSQQNAIDDDIICDYTIINVGVTLTPDEEKEYSIVHNYIKEYFPKFKNDFNLVRSLISTNRIAVTLLKAIVKRKQIIQLSENKIYEAVNIIIDEYNKGSKIILFNELINSTEKIYDLVIKAGIPAGLYHSKIPIKQRKILMEDFKNDKFKVLITPKTIDEGINICAVNVGIIVSGTSTKKQITQRIGRILRKAPGKDNAIIYQLYIKSYNDIESQDLKWVRKRCAGLSSKTIWR
jgi:superfamily II DNA or RNA helicase